jgi:hypothetical protein
LIIKSFLGFKINIIKYLSNYSKKYIYIYKIKWIDYLRGKKLLLTVYLKKNVDLDLFIKK